MINKNKKTMRAFKLLKDTPNDVAGSVYVQHVPGFDYYKEGSMSERRWPAYVVEHKPEFFEEIELEDSYSDM